MEEGGQVQVAGTGDGAYCYLVVNAKAGRRDSASGLGVREELRTVPGRAVGSVLGRAASSVLEHAASSVQFRIEYGHVARKEKEIGSNNRACRRV